MANKSEVKSDVVVAEQDGYAERTEPKRGVAQVRKAELMHVSGLVHDAFFEAERLMNDAHRHVTDVHLSRLREEAGEVDVDRVRDQVTEALVLAETGDHYLRMLQDALRVFSAQPSDPWNRRSFDSL